jgi:hypothetical protein
MTMLLSVSRELLNRSMLVYVAGKPESAAIKLK